MADSERLRFLIIGPVGTGKSAILTRIIGNNPHAEHTSTIGIEFAKASIFLSNNDIQPLLIYDTAGDLRYSINNRSTYYEKMHGVMLVVNFEDLFEMNSFAAKYDHFLEEYCAATEKNIPLQIVINKSDLAGKIDQLSMAAAKANLNRWLESHNERLQGRTIQISTCSARVGTSVKESFHTLTRAVKSNVNANRDDDAGAAIDPGPNRQTQEPDPIYNAVLKCVKRHKRKGRLDPLDLFGHRNKARKIRAALTATKEVGTTMSDETMDPEYQHSGTGANLYNALNIQRISFWKTKVSTSLTDVRRDIAREMGKADMNDFKTR